MSAQCQAIQVEDVSIATASVQIRILHVSGKSLTMGTFRQIPFTDDPTYGSEPFRVWGFVNYYWNGCQAKRKHFVIERGGILWRTSPELKRDVLGPLFFRDGYNTGQYFCRRHFQNLGAASDACVAMFARWENAQTEEDRELFCATFENHCASCVDCGSVLARWSKDKNAVEGRNKRLAESLPMWESAPQLYIAT